MKKRIAILFAALLLVLPVVLCGCTVYTSSYKAVGFVHSNVSDSGYMSFYSFEGKMVFRMKWDGATEGSIKYSAKLESGEATVYYDCGGEKTELFKIGAGDEISSSVGTIGKGTVYVIVETNGKCQNGDFRFSLEKTEK